MKRRLFACLLAVAMVLPLCCIGVNAEGANKAPTVIPAIREWEGATGEFKLPDTVKINKKDAAISDAKQQIITNSFAQYLGVTASFADDGGEIILVTDTSDTGLGKDGYTMQVTETAITIKAPEEIGLLYGIYTVLQSVKADGFVPCGNARDYSYYQIRSVMLDVARAWMPLEYVEEITKYLAFYKLNEFHLHINDNGANEYAAFRLESDVPGLTSEDGYYTKAEYRDYQKRMLEYGVEIITEIDTPAHSRCFQDVVPEYMLDRTHLDISKPETLQFIKDLFDEYITGDDPVFVSTRVHIGTDEYPEGHDEAMLKYTDELIKHINARGYTPRFWGGIGKKGFNGSTPVSPDAETNFWTMAGSDYMTLISKGFDIVNSCGEALYIVPGVTGSFEDYLPLESLYSSWYVNYMGANQLSAIAPDHPQLLGSCLALWNDHHTKYTGFSMYDIFDRLRGGACFIAEKTWCGEQTRNIEAADFMARYEKLGTYAAEGDPGRNNLENISGTVPEGVTSFGWPYVASIDVTVDKLGSGFVLFGGEDGEFYVKEDGSVGFKRGVYDFTYDYKLPEGKTTSLKLIVDNKQTSLVVNGGVIYLPANNKNMELTHSSTFVLPLEKIGEGLDGKVENLSVEGGAFDWASHVIEDFDSKPYKELMAQAQALVEKGAPESLEVAVNNLKECLKADTIYDFQLEGLKANIEEEISAYKTSQLVTIGICVGAGVVVIAAVSIVIAVVAKKKKAKTAEEA